jgi:hypothetical protein
MDIGIVGPVLFPLQHQRHAFAAQFLVQAAQSEWQYRLQCLQTMDVTRAARPGLEGAKLLSRRCHWNNIVPLQLLEKLIVDISNKYLRSESG